MSTAPRVFRHTILQIAARVVGTILGLAAMAIMTRNLGTDGFGAYTTITAYLGFFAVIADFGLSTTLVAMLAEKNADEERLSRNAFGLRIAITATLLALAVVVVLFVPYPPEIKRGVALMTLSFFAIALQQIQVAIFQRHVRMGRPAFAEVFGRALLVLFVWLADRNGSGLSGILLAVIFSNVLQALLGAVFLRAIAPLLPATNWETWKLLLRRTWPVGVSILLNLLYLRADTVILSLTRPQSEVGIYGAAYRAIDVLTVLPFLFMGIVLPFLSAAWSEKRPDRFAHTLSRAVDALSIGAAPLALGALVLGPDLLAFIFGEPFREAGRVLELLIFGVSSIFFGAAFSHAVIAIGQQRRMIPLLAVDAGISLVLYLLLIPRYGMWAAALITVFSELFAALAALWVTRVHGGVRISARIPLRASLAAGAMALLLFFLENLHVGLRLLLGAVFYAIFLVLFRALTPETIRELLSLKESKQTV